MENKVWAILILVVVISLFILAITSINKNKKRSQKIFDELTPLVENAKTINEVNKAWDLLHEKCVSKGGAGYLVIDIAYREDFLRLNTICSTKFKMLAEI